MKALGFWLLSMMVGLIVLFQADALGIDTAFPRGAWILLTADLCALKAWLTLQFFKEITK